MRVITISILFLLTAFLSIKPTPKTYALALPKLQVPEKQVDCLTRAIWHEARGEPFIGQVAVAHVVMNRKADPRWPKTVCEVVYQPNQFTDILLSRPDKTTLEWKEARRIAIVTMLGLDEDPTSGAFYYYSHTKIAAPWWAKSKPVLVRYHNHTFLGDHNG